MATVWLSVTHVDPRTRDFDVVVHPVHIPEDDTWIYDGACASVQDNGPVDSTMVYLLLESASIQDALAHVRQHKAFSGRKNIRMALLFADTEPVFFDKYLNIYDIRDCPITQSADMSLADTHALWDDWVICAQTPSGLLASPPKLVSFYALPSVIASYCWHDDVAVWVQPAHTYVASHDDSMGWRECPCLYCRKLRGESDLPENMPA